MNLSLTTESNVLYHIKNWKEKNDVTLKQTSEQRTFWKILNQIKIQKKKGWYVFTDKNSYLTIWIFLWKKGKVEILDY